MRENYSTSTPEEYYRVALTIPFLDQVISELKNRFSKQHRVHANGFFVIPDVILENKDWRSFVREFSQQYESDMPSKLNLEVEMNMWEQFWTLEKSKKNKIPDTIMETLKLINKKKEWFPNIYTILTLIAVVPPSSNSCERSISRLRLLKTYTRSTMTQERLSGLAALYIHREIPLDYQKVLDIFARDYPHRLALKNLLDTD